METQRSLGAVGFVPHEASRGTREVGHGSVQGLPWNLYVVLKFCKSRLFLHFGFIKWNNIQSKKSYDYCFVNILGYVSRFELNSLISN